MLKFVTTDQQYPRLRKAEERRNDFQEIYAHYAADKAAEQASRCSQCGVPFCHVHCPLGNHIPDWLRLTAEGRLQDAYRVSGATNAFPEICGRICPQDRLCEGNCVVEQADFGTITIGAIEKYITETAWDENWVEPISPAQELPYHVGIIGAGPAGLSAAIRLREAGCSVTIYDRHDRCGGLLMYGIPNFKLDKQVVTRRHQWMEASGIRFCFNHPVEDREAFTQLRNAHDTVLIATGVYQPRDLDIPGNKLQGVIPALDYLITSNRKGMGDAVARFDSGELDAADKHVVVIGGGDTAMDCVRTAIRQGAKEVSCLYRRDRENMPGSAREVAYAEQEGVTFQWLSTPKEFLGDEKVKEVRAIPMRLGVEDREGRRMPEPIPGEELRIKADMVIKALGFLPEDLPLAFGEEALKVRNSGTLKVDRSGMTALPGVFAAGDIVRGASLVVWAVRDGQETAEQMLRWMQEQATEKKIKKKRKAA